LNYEIDALFIILTQDRGISELVSDNFSTFVRNSLTGIKIPSLESEYSVIEVN